MQIIQNYEVEHLAIDAYPNVATLTIRTRTHLQIALSMTPELLARLGEQTRLALEQMQPPAPPQ